jgi:tRNA nucleotidyltransferase (CCA-adding enzyme)
MHVTEFRPGGRAKKIIDLLLKNGATDCLFVGGCMRDHFLGIRSKDYDIEIHGLPYEKIVAVLKPFFRVDLVGQSFGTVKVDNRIDLSVPRSESKAGSGHRGFEIATDPNLDLRTAFARRDFTINAIGLRVDGSVVDFFDGQGDIARKILRAPTEAFCEDPLRVLRGVQFAARFGFEMEPRTVELCRSVRNEFVTLSPERIWAEWFKWATNGNFPSKGLRVLQDTGWLDCFPEIAALVGVPQNPVYHPEGDAFDHTCLTCDAAVKIAGGMKLDEQERAILLFAALSHDFGKPATTILNEKGNWSSPNHAHEGVGPTRAFLQRMLAPHWALENVLPLVREHLAHIFLPKGEYPQDSVVRRLATRLVPSNIRMWTALCRSDALGCGDGKPRHSVDSWEEIAAKLEVRESKPAPLLQGRDLIPLGVAPGPGMGKILAQAYEAQLDGVFTDHTGAVEWAKNLPK